MKSLSARSAELPLADKLRDHVAGLHEILNQVHDRQSFDDGFGTTPAMVESDGLLHQNYRDQLELFRQALKRYRGQLNTNRTRIEATISDDRYERQTLAEIDRVLATC